MAETISIWQRIGREFSIFFRRLSQCFTNCFNPNNSEDDQLLRDGPSQSPSVENNFVDRYEEHSGPIYHPSPNVSRHLNQMSEEEQIRIAQRLGLIQHLPLGSFDGQKKNKECVICMIDILIGDPVRYLPCLHFYHRQCIDDWLMRSFTCPSCMEPVDAALLLTYENNREVL